ncbi:AMP-binding protein [Demequina litorisediminis]|uniref:AMP-dependent synthetase/ligase domain-containing protein n=1 Tax=Demequina litorisediminis TaxID=1849022 RepID=A0ABQ6ICS1_9MICO|nr:AMP-binding protein [Demequina litorisediminis]GMA34529.1 hypothetical protein GCM10025876_07330 [Demequina litorisediminis]
MPENEMIAPGLATVDDRFHLAAMLAARATTRPTGAFAEVKDADGAWRTVTLGDFHSRVRAVAKGLVASGVAPGDRVGVMGDTSIEWSVLDFAILTAGGVTVPIYPSSLVLAVRMDPRRCDRQGGRGRDGAQPRSPRGPRRGPGALLPHGRGA